jgi:4-amino-4-deoxy-L-arabinose transferase-like glycosyltransferase
MNNEKKIYYDYRFWLIIGLLIKVYGLWNPPLEAWHTWRQVNVLMVANNFFDDPNIFFPKIDCNGEHSGITGMEFPLFSYCIFLFNKFIGHSYLWGRLINLVISTIGLYYFYKLVKEFVSEKQALIALILLSFSEWFMYSRKFMPDTGSLSFVIISAYFAVNYLKGGNKNKHLFLFVFWGMIGGLMKLPSLILLAPFMLWFFFENKAPIQKKILFGLACVILMIPVSIWYFYWFGHLVNIYGLTYYLSVDNSYSQGLSLILAHPMETMRVYYKSALGISGFIIFVIGFITLLKTHKTKVWATVGITFILITILMMKSGRAFFHHDYYVLPLVPLMAFVGSYLIQQRIKIVFGLVSIFVFEGILTQMKDLSLKEASVSYLEYEPLLNTYNTDAEAKIITNIGSNPTRLFFLNREGWVLDNERLLDTLDYTIKHGAQYAILFKDEGGKKFKELGFKEIGDNPYFTVYELKYINEIHLKLLEPINDSIK